MKLHKPIKIENSSYCVDNQNKNKADILSHQDDTFITNNDM